MADILVVDDEPAVLETIRDILQGAGHDVRVAAGGEQALTQIACKLPDLIVLDVVMPEIDGLSLCQRIRADPYLARLPVLFLTARSRPSDIAQGLDLGGDDYLTKPFQVIELPARVRALLRRAPAGVLNDGGAGLSVGRLRLVDGDSSVELDGRRISLRPAEYRLLHYLMQRAGHPVSTEQLLEYIWGYPPGAGDPTLVYVHINNLRAKLQPSPHSPQLIRNIRGRGYLVCPN